MSEPARRKASKRKPRKAAQGRPPKSKGKRKGQGQKVDMDTYHHMLRVYADRQTIGFVAKVCGVSEGTARKYIRHGDPSRDLPAIHDIWSSSQAMAVESEKLTLAKARETNLKTVTAMIAKYEKAVAALDPAALKPYWLVNGLERLVKLQERLLGGPDHSVQVETPRSRFEDWTEEELLLYMEKGVAPERDRVKIPPPTR
jgi:hypothetical protein